MEWRSETADRGFDPGVEQLPSPVPRRKVTVQAVPSPARFFTQSLAIVVQ
jgi:hypothetical protein